MDSQLPEFKLYEHQDVFVMNDSKYPALVAGYGAGKTYSLCVKALRECSLNPGAVGLLAEPVYPMVKDTLQPTFEAVIAEVGFTYEYSASDLRYRVMWSNGWADVLLRSAENYRRWAGLNLAWGGIDESALLKDDSAWKMLLSRLRKGNTLTAFTTTTPEGFNYVWDYWIDDPGENYEIIKGKTRDNRSLPEEFIISLEQNYDERLRKAYLDGEFVNLQHGSTYYTFNRETNVGEVEYNQSLPIKIGMDFNVDPITAVLCQTYHEPPKVRVFDEIKIHHGVGAELMTERMCREIKERYPNRHTVIYPDPAGNQRRTSAYMTDHDIIRKEGFEVRAKRTAPPVINRVNSVNKIMESCIVDSRCKHFIRDLEQTVNKEGTRDIDKSNSQLTHLTDGFGYFIDYDFPVRKPTTRTHSL